MKVNHLTYQILKTVLTVCIILLSQTVLFAQTAISASISNTQPSVGEEITAAFSIDDHLDLYYGGLEVSYASGLLEFVSVENTGLTSGGISSSGEISSGKNGASVSRTTPLENPSNGSFMLLNFRVKETAHGGSTVITFENQEIYDSQGNEVATASIADITLDIRESIGDLDLTIPPENTVTEGASFEATAIIYATGVTDTSRIEVWAGIHSENTDPASWDASAWEPMSYSETEDAGYLHYAGEVAYGLTEGNWYIALRARLDEGSYVYGGTDGIWHIPGSPNARLNITSRPSYRYALAEWNFDAETLTPSRAIPANQDAEMQLTGANFQGYSSGSSGQAANSNGWDAGSDGSKYWSVTISTANFSGIQLSSKQYGSGTGPRDFMIETSTDGNNWEMLPGSNIKAATNWSSGVIDSLSLPAELEDHPTVHIRWVMSTDTSISGDIAGSTGTSRMDEVLITGINASAQEANVYPGDANNDGQVNADDVLPLGNYWLSHGPMPVYPSTDFAPRKVEEWIPPGATYADTRGDGKVDHRDLMPIGLHFEKTVSSLKTYSEPVLDEIVLHPKETGAVMPLTLHIQNPTHLNGVSFKMKVAGISPEQWEVIDLQPAFCTNDWQEKMLSFERKEENALEAAFAYKGKGLPANTSKLVTIKLKASREWTNDVKISINRLTISNNKTCKHTMDNARLALLPTGIRPVERKTVGSLLENRPNPFRESTIIPYVLSKRTHVKLQILNINGRVVKTLVDRIQPAGHYNVQLNAAGLSAGTYFYRILTGEGFVQCKKMGVVK